MIAKNEFDMNESVSLIGPRRHLCTKQSVALCALNFKIVVLAWKINNESKKEIQFLILFRLLLLAQAKLFTSLTPFPG